MGRALRVRKMSRIGRQPIEVPDKVTVDISGRRVTVTGPKGSLSLDVNADMRLVLEDNTVRVERPSDDREHRSLHGLTRTLIANMVEGVVNGYEKRLEIHGVGYRSALSGADLELQLGFSHPVRFRAPEGIEFEVPAPNRIVVRGIDKQLVGEVAADIRKLRKPEPYKGKGIRYEGEYVRKKAGKAAKGAMA
jgi:large subunit ribosomal protein L6